MYPAVPGVSGPSGSAPSSRGPSAYPAEAQYLGDGAGGRPSGPTPSGPPPSGLARQPSRQNSTGNEWASSLHVVVADEYRVDPPIQVPPALEAVARPHQAVDFEFERRVMADEASTSLDSFLAKPEEAYYKEAAAGRFIGMGFTPAAVALGLAYQSATRGDESRVVDFCNNYSQLLGMGFAPALAGGALVRTGNDVSAAAEMCLAAGGA